MTPEDIGEMFRSLEQERKSLRESIAEVMWHFRGSVSRDEAWSLSPIERKEYAKAIKDRIKVVEETGLPLL